MKNRSISEQGRYVYGFLIISLLSSLWQFSKLFGFKDDYQQGGYGSNESFLDFLNAPKTDIMTSDMPENPRMFLIHVGKAGGVSLDSAIEWRNREKAVACRMEKNRNHENEESCYKPPKQGEPAFSRKLVARIHVHSPLINKTEERWLLDNTNIFLFTIRDPIDRIISAYNYHRHQLEEQVINWEKENNQSIDWAAKKYPKLKMRANVKIPFYRKCFPNGLDHFVEVMQYNGTDSVILKCQILGLEVLRNRKRGRAFKGGAHFLHNYRRYASRTIYKRPDKSIAVIRTKHLWDDVISLDKSFGGDGYFKMKGRKYSHGSQGWTGAAKYTAALQPSNAKYLCCLIYDEIKVYQHLVLRSFNLNDTEKRETMMETLNQCQIGDTSDDSFHLPFSFTSYYKNTCEKEILSLDIANIIRSWTNGEGRVMESQSY